MNLALTDAAIPARLRTERPMTDDELFELCRRNDTLRVERDSNGELLVMTPAGFGTSRMNQRIGRFLDEWAEADGRGVATDSNGGYSLPNGAMRAPDAGWVSLRKVESLTEQQKEGFAPFAPDFVIELLSPSDRLAGVRAKMEEWIANGVELAWLIDPKRRVVEVYRLGEAVEVHEDPSSVLGTGVVAGFCLVMGRVWG